MSAGDEGFPWGGDAMARPALVIVDVQERLFGAMDAERRDEMLRNVKTLVAVARRLELSVLLTEQYPRGLGRTLPELRTMIDDVPPLEKTAFSCCAADGFMRDLDATDGDRVILCGLETHVCVLLTALDLLGRGRPTTIVADATCARARANHELGLAQARQAGVVVSSTETIVFQLLERADTDAFRELSKLLR
jgi:nicotinamidase-related amidase